MKKLSYSVATENDIPFIMETYNKNIEALHGIHRDYDTWKNLLLNTTDDDIKRMGYTFIKGI